MVGAWSSPITPRSAALRRSVFRYTGQSVCRISPTLLQAHHGQCHFYSDVSAVSSTARQRMNRASQQPSSPVHVTTILDSIADGVFTVDETMHIMPYADKREHPGQGRCAGRGWDPPTDTHADLEVKAEHQAGEKQELVYGVGRGGRPHGGGRGHCHGGSHRQGKKRENPSVTE